MKKWVVLTMIVAVMFILTGCGYQEGIRQPDRQSFIWFSGDTTEAVAIIDDNEPFRVVQAYYVDSDTGERVSKNGRTLYQIKPGRHVIIVKKNGEVVVHRDLIIGAGATKEVRVP
ncbi:MAG: hypothetical protein OQK52_09625 [Ignavibacteriaceae bacterium]|jgi:uncharacterized protein YcfL|nr:hypothetical protein [Ignavibacteriaceae bacterium]MCW8818118.1 hypothetical protein [Ignavibacteriaceae bacterium]MCW8822764.1 hypothetical protein [Ignavibacteriaceae bacterium]